MPTDEAFKIVVMGCTGGPREGNLSGYLLSSLDDESWIALDTGTLLTGIEKAYDKGAFAPFTAKNPKLTPAGEILHDQIRAYLISHAHLDHIAGLVLNSVVDSPKPVLGIDPTIDNLRDHIFNGRIWPNYGSEGFEPKLNFYQYTRLPLHDPQPIPTTHYTVESYLLSHPRGYPSTAFLIESHGRYLLYFGDTASDKLEHEKHLARVWKRIAPLIQAGSLHAIMLECSLPHHEVSQAAFGHLDSKLMMGELDHLQEIAQCSLKGLKVIVTHRKENLKAHYDIKEAIKEELRILNTQELELIFPTQGDKILV